MKTTVNKIIRKLKLFLKSVGRVRGEKFFKEGKSVAELGLYINRIQKFLNKPALFRNFRRDEIYMSILGGSNYQMGEMSLKQSIQQGHLSIMDIKSACKADLIGNPIRYQYINSGESFTASPNTLRYCLMISLIIEYFGAKKFNKIAEVGGGYGGQFLVADMFLNICDYHIYDIDLALNLTTKYLNNFIIDSAYTTKHLNNHNGNTDYDLVLSSYAFSELPEDLQVKYVNKVLSRSKRGLLVMNSGMTDSEIKHGGMSIERLEKILPKFRIIEECPRLIRGNYIILWGDGK